MGTSIGEAPPLDVLILDEDAENAATVQRDTLRFLGDVTVQIISEPELAAGWLGRTEHRPDLVLIGAAMFERIGLAILQERRADIRLGRIPVVLLTWPRLSMEVEQAFELGISAYISRPSYYSDLHGVLDNARLYREALATEVADEPDPAAERVRERERVILLVEDDRRAAAAVAQALGQAGLPAPVQLTEGAAAARWAGTNDCDLCLLDLTLPDIDGLEALSRIRQRKSDLPVVMMSDANSERAAVAAFHSGVLDYVPKGRGYAGTVAWLASQVLALRPGGAVVLPYVGSVDVPAALLRPTYQNRLRVIGRQLDIYSYGATRIVETTEGFIARGTVPGSPLPETLVVHHRSFPQVAAGAIALRNEASRRRSMSALLPSGYEDFLRALGYALDAAAARAVTITELGSFFVVGGAARSDAAEEPSMAPFQWFLAPRDIARLLDDARRRRDHERSGGAA